MDTSKDYRIIVAEAALKDLEKIVRNRRLPFPIKRDYVLFLIRDALSKLMAVKYSFLPESMLVSSQTLSDFCEVVGKISENLQSKGVEKPDYRYQYTLSEIRWILRTLTGLKERFKLEGNYVDYSVDVLGAKIMSVSHHDKLERLWVLKGSTVDESFIIVTNLPRIKRGEVRAIAVLPPREFEGVISEAMICSNTLPEGYIGKRPGRTMYNFKEVTNLVEEYLARHKML
ncbi:MAG: tRNA-binding protein [Thermoprotei archaeon]|nr:MAG: tRNA-binding protein [Thermoprotei archaeon]